MHPWIEATGGSTALRTGGHQSIESRKKVKNELKTNTCSSYSQQTCLSKSTNHQGSGFEGCCLLQKTHGAIVVGG